MNNRKHPRLNEFDYTQPGGYFVTVCTKNKSKILCNILHDIKSNETSVELSAYGKIVDKYIKNINAVYDGVKVSKYVIMPNHLHILFVFNDLTDIERKGAARRTSLQTVIRSLKTMVTKEISKSIWQPSFYEKTVRTKRDFKDIWKYIDENPLKWVNDDYYI